MKVLNSREPRSENQEAISTFETVSKHIYTVGLEKAVLPVSSTKTKVQTTFIEAIYSEYSEEWFNAMKLELESIKSKEVTVLNHLSNIPRNTKVIGTKRVF